MVNASIKIVTIFYHPTSPQLDEYEQLLNHGFSIDIWLNSLLEKNIQEGVEYLGSIGANIYQNEINNGIANILNNYLIGHYNDCDYMLFLDQDTIIEPTKFSQYIRKNENLIRKNYLTYFYSVKEPDLFFTNSGSLFNLQLTSMEIDKFYFVELVDYFLLVEILNQSLPYSYERVDFINHYSGQDNIDELTGLKNYSYERKKEVTVATFKTIRLLIKKSNISVKIKFKMINHLVKNLITIIR